MRTKMNKGYTCEGLECGRYNLYPPYVFAHYDVELVHTCECGKRNIILRGKVIGQDKPKSVRSKKS